MNIDSLRAFTDRLRTEVDLLRHRGLSEMADVLESVANDHEEVLDGWHAEELTLREAEAESGLSYSTLQQKKHLHVGTPGSPRIRRCDLHQRRRGAGPRLATSQPDIAGKILASRLAG